MITYYVDTTLGSDRNNGNENEPFRTIEHARDEIRSLKQSIGLTSQVTVFIRGGMYALNAPLAFGPEDSGTERTPITYAAYPGERPVISGGRRIGEFDVQHNGWWKANIREAATGEWTFEQLWVNGKWAVRARTPNEGYSYIDDHAGVRRPPGSDTEQDCSKTAFKPLDPQITEQLAQLTDQELDDAMIRVYNTWVTALRRVSWVHKEDNVVALSGNAYYIDAPFAPFTRYHLENVRSALDAPGEWFLSRQGELIYIPREGEDASSSEVIAPVLDTLVKIEGAPGDDKYVEHLLFRGLTFSHSKHDTPPDGYMLGQAASSIGIPLPAVIELKGARFIRFEQNEICNIARYAISMEQGCSQIIVRQNDMHDLGAGGVRVGETVHPAPPEPFKVHHITVDNNIIRGGGRLHPEGVGVLIGQASDNAVSHNEISDFYYSGISAGWCWTSAETDSVRNMIEYNHIHHIGQKVMDDLGGIYTVGLGTDSVIRNNVIHNVTRYGFAGVGIYNDNASRGYVLENNLVYDIEDWGYLNGFARDIMIRNNIFAYTGLDAVKNISDQCDYAFFRESFRSSFAVERNVILVREGRGFSAVEMEPLTHRHEGNAYYHEGDPAELFVPGTLDELKRKHRDASSQLLNESPFVDAGNRDFRIKPGVSFASDTGFVPFDYSQAGVYGEADWMRYARKYEHAKAEKPQLPRKPPVQIVEDYETTPVGSPMRSGKTTNVGASRIGVTDELAKSAGGRSLKFDIRAADAGTPFFPSVELFPYHYSGTSTMSMDIWMGAGANMHIVWEDRTDLFRCKTGVALKLVDGALYEGEVTDAFGITVRAGSKLTEVPAGRWFRLQIEAGIGCDFQGEYSVSVTPEDGATVMFTGLRSPSGEMPAFNYAGIYSLKEKNDSVMYIDRFSLVSVEGARGGS